MILQLTFNYQIPAEQLNPFAPLPEHTQTRRPQHLGRKVALSSLWERETERGEHLAVCVCFCMCDTATDHEDAWGEEWAYERMCVCGESDC